MKSIRTKDIVMLALLIGLNIVFSRLVSISAWNFKISLTFPTLLVAGYLYGPLGGALVGGVGDLIGSLAFPIGAYNPLFTVTAVLSGLIFGIFHYNNTRLLNTILACIINQICVSLLLNTWFISIVYNASFKALLSTRIIQAVVMLAIEFIVIRLLDPFLPRLRDMLKQ